MLVVPRMFGADIHDGAMVLCRAVRLSWIRSSYEVITVTNMAFGVIREWYVDQDANEKPVCTGLRSSIRPGARTCMTRDKLKISAS